MIFFLLVRTLLRAPLKKYILAFCFRRASKSFRKSEFAVCVLLSVGASTRQYGNRAGISAGSATCGHAGQGSAATTCMMHSDVRSRLYSMDVRRARRVRAPERAACVSFLESYSLARLPCDTEPCAQSLSNKVHSAGRQQARSISFPICPHLEPRGTRCCLRCCLQCWRKGHTHARTRHGR